LNKKVGLFTVLLSSSIALYACSAEKETKSTADKPAAVTTENVSNESSTEKQSIEEMKAETQGFWEAVKNVDAPKLNDSLQVWGEYYAQKGLSSRIASQVTTSSPTILTYQEGKDDQGEYYIKSFSLAPHNVNTGYDTTMSFQDALSIAKNLIPKGYEQKEETFSVLYQDPPSLLRYQVEYVATGSVPKGSEHLYLVITYNNLGTNSVSTSTLKSEYSMPEAQGKYTYLKPDLINDEAALKNLTEVQSKQDIKPEYIVQ